MTWTTFIAGGALEQFGHDPLVGRVQVLDDDEGHAAPLRHVPQELLQASSPPAEAPMPTMGKGKVPAVTGAADCGRLGWLLGKLSRL